MRQLERKIIGILLVAIMALIFTTGHCSIFSQTPSPTPTASSSPTLPTPTPSPIPLSSEEPTEQIPIPTPYVPEFTVEQKDNNTIEIIIKNQPFDWNNTYQYSFFYNVRTRINDGNWSDLYNIEDGYPLQSHSDYTALVYSSLDNDKFVQISPSPDPYESWIYAPYNAKLDVQVQAYIGYRERGPFQLPWPYVFNGESSGWTETQTLTIGELQTPTPSPEPTPELATTIFGVVIIAVVLGAALGLLVYLIKRK